METHGSGCDDTPAALIHFAVGLDRRCHCQRGLVMPPLGSVNSAVSWAPSCGDNDDSAIVASLSSSVTFVLGGALATPDSLNDTVTVSLSLSSSSLAVSAIDCLDTPAANDSHTVPSFSPATV